MPSFGVGKFVDVTAGVADVDLPYGVVMLLGNDVDKTHVNNFVYTRPKENNVSKMARVESRRSLTPRCVFLMITRLRRLGLVTLNHCQLYTIFLFRKS